MALICSHISWNGEKSVLAQQLTDKYSNPALTDRVMSYIYSDDFTVKYGDWKSNASSVPVDTIAKEPTIEWIENKLQIESPKQSAKVEQKAIALSEPSTRIKKADRISKEKLQAQIRKELIEVAKKSPNTQFFLNYPDLSSRYTQNSGYTLREYAQLLDELREEIPDNIIFSAAFKSAMDNNPARISRNLERLIENQELRVPVNMDGNLMTAQKIRMTIPIVDETNSSTGFFNEIEQEEAEQAVLYAVYTSLVRSPNEPVVKVLHRVLNFFQKAETKATGQLQEKFRNIVRSFSFNSRDERPSFATNTFEALKQLGYNIDPSTKNKILDFLDSYKNIYETPNDTATFNGTPQDQLTTSIEENKEEEPSLEESTFNSDASLGRGAEDWSSVSFEIDQRDTASTRMKVFMSTIEKSINGKYKEATSKEDALDLSKVKSVTEINTAIAQQANGKLIWHDDKKLGSEIIQYLNQEYQILPLRNSLGLPQLVDFDNLFELALNKLANQSDQTIENYTRILRESGNPDLRALVNKLTGKVPGKPATNQDTQLQNEFIKVFSKQYNPFLTVLAKEKTDSKGQDYTEVRLINAQRSSQIQTIVKQWQEANKLSDMMIVKEDGSKALDVKRARGKHLPVVQAYNIIANLIPRYPKNTEDYASLTNTLSSLLKPLTWNLTIEETINDFNGSRTYLKNRFKNIFSEYGIELTDDMLEGIFGLGNLEKLTKGTRREGNLSQAFSITQDGRPNGLFSIFFMKAAGLNSDMDIDETELEEGIEQATLNNPLWTESTTVSALAKVAANYTPSLFSSTHKSIEGKKIWDFSQNTALSKRLQLLKNDFDATVQDYNDTDLISKDGTISDGSFYLRYWKSNPREWNNFSLYYMEGLNFGNRNKGVVRDKMSDREQLLMSIAAFQNGNKNTGHFLSLTHSDKTMTPVGYNVPKIETGIELLEKQAVDELRQIFYAEHRRISLQKDSSGDKAYDIGKKYFYFLPQFNKEAMLEQLGTVIPGTNIRLTQKEINKLWNEDGSIKPNTDQFKQILDAYLVDFIHNLANNTVKTWNENSITTKLFDKRVVDSYNRILQSELSPEEKNRLIFESEARKYAFNHYLWNTNLSMLFFGDPAQEWKGSVPATMVEYAKRLAKDIAPGQDLAFPENSSYNTITLKDVKISEKYITDLGINNESNGTDAQELTTVQEHLDVMYAGGVISRDKHSELSQVIRDADGEYYQFSKDQLDIILQPMKPVYAGFRKALNGVMLYDYIKSSSYPLLPQFTKGLEIDNLRDWMERNNVQRTNFESAKKVGQPTHVATVFTKDGHWKGGPEIQRSVQTLSRNGFRIQQDVPYDEEKESIKIVSQMNKLIVEGLSGVDTTFILPDGTQMNSEELRAHKENLRREMLNKSMDKLFQKLGVKQLPDGSYSGFDIRKIARVLQEEAEARGYSDNEIEVLRYLTDEGTFEVPLFLHPSVEKFESLIMSMVRKASEAKMPGKSYVQASSVGYVIKKKEDISTTNITWVGDYNPSMPLRHQQLIGDQVVPAQVIMPFNFFYSDGRKANIDDFTIMQDGKKILDMERIPKELLQLIGARIPNQGHNSMMAMEIVGFTPEQMGDIIIVPSAITGQMGSDFDVDKLFTYKRSYVESENKFSPEPSLESSYFDVHWAVLTNKDMYRKVMNPLDKKDLKDMNKKYKAAAPQFYNYFDVISQLSEFQSGKDAKTLVGLSSLSVTFNSVIQDKDIKLGSYEWDEETSSMKEVEDFIEVEYKGERLKLNTMSGNGTNVYGDEIRTKHDNLTTIQSAAVDNAKDKTLDSLNIGLATYPAIAALHQLQTEDGKIVNLDLSTALTVQPIIWEFSKEMRQGNDSMSNQFIPNLKAHVTSKLREKYERLAGETKVDFTISPENLSKEWTKFQNGTSAESSPEFAATQLAILNIFEKLHNYGERLSVLQKTFNQDTNGAGPNILYAIQQQENYSNLYKRSANKLLLGESEISRNGSTEQGYFFEKLIPFSLQLSNELFPISSMYNAINAVVQQTGKQLTDIPIDQQRSIIRSLRSYAVTGTTVFGQNPDVERVRLLNTTSVTKSLAVRVEEAKRNKLKNNYFIQRLSTNISVLGNGPDFVNYENAKTIRLDDEKNVTAFMDMLSSSDKEVQLLAEDLIRYTYLLNPQNGPTSFIRHIPTSYLVATSFAKDMQTTMNNLEFHTQSEVFVTQLYQHNPNLALEANAALFTNYLSEGQDFPEWFMFDADTNNELKVSVVEEDGNAATKYTDFLRYFSRRYGQNILYKKKSEGASIVYQRIDTLGKSDKTEYNANTTSTVRSIFPENRAMVEWTPAITMQQALTNQIDRMLGETENKDNQYANWGLPKKGSMLEINKALKQMSQDRELPQYIRTVADLISSSSQTLQERDALEAAEIKQKKFRFEVDENIPELGSYVASLGLLKLRPIGNKIKAAETILHEMSHQRTAAIAAAMGYIDEKYLNTFSKEIRKEVEEVVEKYRNKHPELHSKFKRLDSIRYEALQKFQKRMSEGGYDLTQIISEVESGKLKSENHRIYYGLSNLQEFLAHVWTNKETMTFLNTLEADENKTIVQKIWDLLTDILIQVGEFLGTNVKDKSLLKEALMLTLHVNNLSTTESLGVTIMQDKIAGEITTLTEAKADQVSDIIESSYNQQIQKGTDGVRWHLDIKNKRLDVSSNVVLGDTVSRIVKKMELQVADLNKILSTRITSDQDKKRRIRVEAMRKEIQADIEDMTQQRDLMAITDVGQKQLEWVKKIISKPEPLIQEITLASNILDMWVDVNNTIYDKDMETVNLEFKKLVNELQGNATDMNNTLMRLREKAILNFGRDKGVRIDPKDLNSNLKANSGLGKYALTLSRDRNPAIQLMTSIGQQGANNSDEEQNRLKKRLDKIEKDVLKIAGSSKNVDKIWNKFIQESEDGKSFGLVQPLSVEWYRSTSKARYDLSNTIKRINTRINNAEDTKGSIAFEAAKKEDKKKAFSKYWETINKYGTVIDIRKLIDLDTGERLNNEMSTAEYERLLNISGDKDVVDKAVEKALSEYQEYLEHKSTAFEALDETELSEKDLSKIQLTSEQKGTMSEEDQAKELDKLKKEALKKKIEQYKALWIHRNSPASFIGTQTRSSGDSKFSHNLEFLPQFVPRKNEKWFDTKYQEIQKDEKLKEVYKEFVDMSETFRDYLPPNESKKLRDNFLPIVTTQDVNNFYSMLTKFSISEARQKVLNAFSVSQSDKDRVAIDEIPINFLNKGRKDTEDLSRDLPKIFEMFGNMAIHYKNMRPVQEVVETVERLVHDVDVQRKLGNEEESLKHLSESIKFYKDMLVFKKPKKLEMVSEHPIYDLNPMKNKKIEKRVVEIKKELDKLKGEEELFDEEGNIIISNSQQRIDELETELKKYEDNARYLTGSKAADVMIGINQLKALSFNPFSAINNLTFGVMSGFIHAYGKVDYTPADYRWGLKKMRGSIARSYAFNSVEVGESKKVRNIMDRIGVISEILETMYGKSNLQSKQKSGFRKIIDPFGWQKSGDYLTKGAMVLAMMRNRQVEVEIDGQKKMIPLYEAINENGEWNEEKYGENRLWSAENIEEQTEWNKFRDKSRKVSTIVFGNQDKNQPLLAKKYMLGRLIGQFRLSWLPEGINTRWGKEYYDEQLGRWVKGRWRTMKELGIPASAKTLLRQIMSVFTKSDPFAGTLKKDGNELSDVDKENMRKNLAGITYTSMFLGAIMALKLMGPDEEEKRRRRRQGKDAVNTNMLILNMLTRSYQDLALYSSPEVFDQVLGNLVPSVNVPMDIGRAIKAVGKLPFMSDRDYEKKDAGTKAVKKVFRAIPIVNLIPKIQYMSERDISTIAR